MRMKRFLAGFLCLCMVGTMDMPYVQAAAVAAKSEPVAQESAKQDAEDAKPSEDVENQDNDQRSEAAKQKEVVTDTQAAEQAESAGSTENKTEQTALLNYALIDQPTVEMPGTQNVLLSIGDENTVIESAVLDYVNETTGKSISGTGIYDQSGCYAVYDGVSGRFRGRSLSSGRSNLSDQRNRADLTVSGCRNGYAFWC